MHRITLRWNSSDLAKLPGRVAGRHRCIEDHQCLRFGPQRETAEPLAFRSCARIAVDWAEYSLASSFKAGAVHRLFYSTGLVIPYDKDCAPLSLRKGL